ncbi:MAG: hypothetical protein A2283_20515 [Lentisphaerae bacterium RIFOXYA12_FULL_48_11]|nr:MAG: hypothetical protein A2283_20515 [Lentisphaerae bacterium RIFOXYA12_FULL_48_11]
MIENRTSDVCLTVRSANGKPLSGKNIEVRQVRHKFLFGSNAFLIESELKRNDKALYDAYCNRFSALMNYATLPFYWGSYEKEQNRTGEDRLKRMAEWCVSNEIRPKGHPLLWHQVPPGWLGAKNIDEIEFFQLGRIEREIKTFTGLIDTWDVVNEAVVMPKTQYPVGKLCAAKGNVELIKKAFECTRKQPGNRTLLLNDYDDARKYAELIHKCVQEGVGIDVIGYQSHMHSQYWKPQRTWEVCQLLGHFGKPLHFTELTILSGREKPGEAGKDDDHKGWTSEAGDEQIQAERVTEFYSILFSHPSVEAITWWDFSDLRAWRKAPAGLLRSDMSPKPAYDALLQLIKKDWWTGPLKLKTDKDGRVFFRGFLGKYHVNTEDSKSFFEIIQPGKSDVLVKLGGKQ